MSTATFTREDQATFHERLANLRQAIRLDSTNIPIAKREIRTLQKAGNPLASLKQSELSKIRKFARARHLISGFLRGRSWAQMENNHPEGDPRLAFYLRTIWAEVSPDNTLPIPTLLEDFLG